MKSVDRGVLPHSVNFYHTPSEIAKELFYYPTWVGHYYCTHEYEFHRRSYSPMLLFFVREGVLHVKYRGEEKRARAGDVVLLDCSEPHHYYAEDGLEFLYLHFDGLNSHELSQHIVEEHGWLMHRENNMMIGKLIYDMIKFYEQNGVESPFQRSMRIYKLFELLMTPTSYSRTKQSPIDTAIQYIRSNVGKAISLEELACIANLSPYYFSHCFKRQTGFSPLDYVINTRIEKAKVMLLRTNRSISEIAYEVGYSSSGSLINMFVKRVGESPNQYRKNHQGLKL